MKEITYSTELRFKPRFVKSFPNANELKSWSVVWMTLCSPINPKRSISLQLPDESSIGAYDDSLVVVAKLVCASNDGVLVYDASGAFRDAVVA